MRWLGLWLSQYTEWTDWKYSLLTGSLKLNLTKYPTFLKADESVLITNVSWKKEKTISQVLLSVPLDYNTLSACIFKSFFRTVLSNLVSSKFSVFRMFGSLDMQGFTVDGTIYLQSCLGECCRCRGIQKTKCWT